MISFDWMWPLPNEFGTSSSDKAHCPKRQSICELEGDASVDGLSSLMAILTHKIQIMVSSATVILLITAYLFCRYS